MPVNALTFNQVATVLNSIMEQATGETGIVATNTAEFVQQAQTALLTGFDTITNSINQVLSRTIFSVRPYNAKFQGLEVSESAWGNHVRKLSIADADFVDDDRYKWPVGYDSTQSNPSGNGQSVDPFIISKPDLIQTNFYGQSVYENSYTLFRDQLEQAFRGPDEMSEFLTLIMTNRSNKLEQARESMARMTLTNLIGSCIAAEDNSARGTGMGYIKLLTAYNAATGLSLTAQTVFQPANYKAFVQWSYGYLANVAYMFTERTSDLYQTTINGKHIPRHTPYDDQRIYLNAYHRFAIEMMALADTYHDSYLGKARGEAVGFWQSSKDPQNINLTANYTTALGAVATDTVDTSASGYGAVLGIIMDRNAAGYAVTQMWSEPQINARGGYTTYWDHATLRNWNDNTEKAVAILLA